MRRMCWLSYWLTLAQQVEIFDDQSSIKSMDCRRILYSLNVALVFILPEIVYIACFPPMIRIGNCGWNLCERFDRGLV